MHPGAATKLCCALLPLVTTLFAACAASGTEPARLSTEQMARCREAEAAFRSNAADWPKRRDEIAADPVAAAWLVRMFVRDVFSVREGRPLGDDQELLRAVERLFRSELGAEP